jgi:hypothetical protein
LQATDVTRGRSMPNTEAKGLDTDPHCAKCGSKMGFAAPVLGSPCQCNPLISLALCQSWQNMSEQLIESAACSLSPCSLIAAAGARLLALPFFLALFDEKPATRIASSSGSPLGIILLARSYTSVDIAIDGQRRRCEGGLTRVFGVAFKIGTKARAALLRNF